MSSLPRKVKREKYTKKVNGRVIKLDRPPKTHEATLPIKDEKQIKKLYKHLLYLINIASGDFQQYVAERNYIMVILGINTGLRAEDLLQLKVNKVKRLWVTENKTQKQQDFFLSVPVKRIVMEYIARYELEPNDYLFQSRNGDGYPITRQQAFRIMKQLGKQIDIEYSFGLHSLRKTFGYQTVVHSKDKLAALEELKEMFNHSSITVTERYICWDRDDVEKARKNIAIGLGGVNATRAYKTVTLGKEQYSKNKKKKKSKQKSS